MEYPQAVEEVVSRIAGMATDPGTDPGMPSERSRRSRIKDAAKAAVEGMSPCELGEIAAIGKGYEGSAQPYSLLNGGSGGSTLPLRWDGLRLLRRIAQYALAAAVCERTATYPTN